MRLNEQKGIPMRMATLFARTLRDAPHEAEHAAYQLALRAGLVRALQTGSFAILPLGMRVVRKIEQIIHKELEAIAAQELRIPLVQSAQAWERSGRYQEYGPLMLRFADRTERPLLFAPTNEEPIAELARREITSYRHMPALVYQIHTKYRDELRPKGGLLRLREFTMLDAYSLDADPAGLAAAYQRIGAAFERIFQHCGIRYVAAQASGGEMGGSETTEYLALSEAGEDEIVICPSCGYAANAEVATTGEHSSSTSAVLIGETEHRADQHQPIEARAIVATPHCTTIADVAAFMGVAEAATAKAVFFDSPERGLIFVVIRGDREVSEAKLRIAAGVSALTAATSEQILAAGAVPGYASPVGLAIQRTSDPQSGPGVVVIADHSVANAIPLVAGANQAGCHFRNVVYGRDWNATFVADVAAVRIGDPCPRCGTGLTIESGIEIGHIFQLGTRYAEALGATFLDQSGIARPIVMGSYGIGLERLLHVIIEQHHDSAGIIWPPSVAPYQAHLIRLGKSEATRSAADILYQELGANGIAVLYDDRDETPGIKFNDADLIGLPLRLLVSDRMLAEGVVEVKPRAGAAIKVNRDSIVQHLRQ